MRACLFLSVSGFTQKHVGELSLVYNSVITNAQDSSKKINSTTGYYLKGNLSRAEVNSNLFSSVTIYDSKKDQVSYLKK